MSFIRIKKSLSIIVLLSSALISPSLFADDYKIIRFYKLNKKGEQNRLVMKEKRLKLAGCHNFTLTPKVYKLTQIGFKSCSLYSVKNCKIDTEISGLDGKNNVKTDFTEGKRWMFNQQTPRGTKAKSWRCE